MKCARLHLQERSKPKSNSENQVLIGKPRRYCQKRLVNPEHEEDPRWIDVLKRFHCKPDVGYVKNQPNNPEARHGNEDIFLTVQTLQFKGDAEQEQIKRPRTSFKYKTVPDGNKHRMFVKQPITDNEFNDEDRLTSQLTCYFDDYIKYLFNSDKSRPTSSKSGLRGVSDNIKENKATQVKVAQKTENKKPCHEKNKVTDKTSKTDSNNDMKFYAESIEDAKITYRKSGKRKSLTISRTQSPETVQVIRVEVVCNYGSSLSSDQEDKKIETSANTPDLNLENMSVKNSHFANKYLLTNTIKTLDENLSGGAKVTLLCKTFKLSDRSKPKIGTDRQHTRILKDVTRNDIKVKTPKQLVNNFVT